MMRILLAMIVLMMATLSGPVLAAGEQIGHIKKVSGKVYIIRGGEKMTVLAGAPIMQKDIIETTGNGTVGLTFRDNTVFSAGPNSLIEMEDFTFNSRTFKGSLLARMNRGTLVVTSGDIARGSPGAMQIRTPSAVLGVRGTTFMVKVQE